MSRNLVPQQECLEVREEALQGLWRAYARRDGATRGLSTGPSAYSRNLSGTQNELAVRNPRRMPHVQCIHWARGSRLIVRSGPTSSLAVCGAIRVMMV